MIDIDNVVQDSSLVINSYVSQSGKKCSKSCPFSLSQEMKSQMGSIFASLCSIIEFRLKQMTKRQNIILKVIAMVSYSKKTQRIKCSLI